MKRDITCGVRVVTSLLSDIDIHIGIVNKNRLKRESERERKKPASQPASPWTLVWQCLQAESQAEAGLCSVVLVMVRPHWFSGRALMLYSLLKPGTTMVSYFALY